MSRMSRTDSPLLHLHPNDNVLVARTALSLGQEIPELGVRARARCLRATRSPRAASQRASR